MHAGARYGRGDRRASAPRRPLASSTSTPGGRHAARRGDRSRSATGSPSRAKSSAAPATPPTRRRRAIVSLNPASRARLGQRFDEQSREAGAAAGDRGRRIELLLSHLYHRSAQAEQARDLRRPAGAESVPGTSRKTPRPIAAATLGMTRATCAVGGRPASRSSSGTAAASETSGRSSSTAGPAAASAAGHVGRTHGEDHDVARGERARRAWRSPRVEVGGERRGLRPAGDRRRRAPAARRARADGCRQPSARARAMCPAPRNPARMVKTG